MCIRDSYWQVGDAETDWSHVVSDPAGCEALRGVWIMPCGHDEHAVSLMIAPAGEPDGAAVLVTILRSRSRTVL